jgi:hypothetical protein
MNKTVSIGAVKGNLWTGELPYSTFEPENVVLSTTNAIHFDENSKEVSGALEVFIPRGARVLYGLVGGVFTPDNNADNLKIEVGYINQLAIPCSLPLASGTGEAYVGLEKEYAEAVSSGLQKAIAHHPIFPPGVIKVNCGVISIFGSAPLLYERLGKNLYQVLVSQYQGITIREDIFKLNLN